MDEWIHNEILDGLSRLLCLSLERTPAADMIQGTAMAWVEALTANRAWDEARDRPRFRRAFVTLAGQRRSWPAPADFLESLPRVEMKALPKLHIPPNPERVKAALDEISKSLNGEVAR